MAGGSMGRVHVQAHGSFPPDVFVRALTDFGPGRSEVFGNNAAADLRVHDRGDTWAEVTEGSTSGGVWQRTRYDWSTPGQVLIDVVDSNAFGPGSRWLYRVAPAQDGGTDIDLRIRRVPNTTKGRLLDRLLSLGAGHVFFTRDLRHTVRTLESRLSPAP
jgi:hypothetical protein